MNGIKQLNLLVSFLLEIALLIIAGYTGYHLGRSSLISIILSIILPGIIIVFWGLFAAPKSNLRLNNPLRTIFKLFLFVSGTIACLTMGYFLSGIVFGTIVLANVMTAHILSQDY